MMFIFSILRVVPPKWERKRRTRRATRKSHQQDKSRKTPEILHVQDPSQALSGAGLGGINGTKIDRFVRKRIVLPACRNQRRGRNGSRSRPWSGAVRSVRQQWDCGFMEPRPDSQREIRPNPLDVPPNPNGGRTLIVDARDPTAYVRPSTALIEAREEDQVFVRPGIYEDKVFVSERPVRLIGAGRDYVQIFCRRGGPLYLQRVSSGIISGLTFRYVGSDQYSAINVLDSNLLITQSRALEGVLSGVVIYGPECRVNFHDNEVCHNRESGIFVFAGAQPRVSNNSCFGNHHFGIAIRDPAAIPSLFETSATTI